MTPLAAARASLVPALALVALSLGGCGGSEAPVEEAAPDPTVSQETLEQRVVDDISGEGAEDVEVTCEGDLAAELDATQDCLATLGESATGIRFTVDAVDGEDVDYSSVVFVPEDELASTVEDTYLGQGVAVDSVTCDGELLGVTGESAVCEVTSMRDGDASIEATTTKVEGLLVDFDLTVLLQY